jgi:hypothetical protein
MALEYVSPVVSVAALGISLFTLWFTGLRRGEVRSTHPSFIAIRYDFVGKKAPQAKIFHRALLYSTGKRGHAVESLFLRVREGARQEEFSFWGYGDKDLVRGSGLFVPESGIATNPHFNPLDADELFLFSKGMYSLELVAKAAGSDRLFSLWTVTVEMPEGVFGNTISRDSEVYFSWSPGQKRYIASVAHRSDDAHASSAPAGN